MMNDADAAFIAAARTAVPELLAENERLRKALDKVRNKIEAASYHRNYRQACIDIFNDVLTPSPWWRDAEQRDVEPQP